MTYTAEENDWIYPAAYRQLQEVVDYYNSRQTAWPTYATSTTGWFSASNTADSWIIPVTTASSGSSATITFNTYNTALNTFYRHTIMPPARKKVGRLEILIKNHRGHRARAEESGTQFSDASPQELLALQLLRKMVTPDDFRKYLRQGFISVRGASGLIYNIFRNPNKRIEVWQRGSRLAQLCVHVGRWEIPPTDEVVAKKLIIECEEKDIWKRSNITWMSAARVDVNNLGVDTQPSLIVAAS